MQHHAHSYIVQPKQNTMHTHEHTRKEQ